MSFNFRSLVGGRFVYGHDDTDGNGNPAGGFAQDIHAPVAVQAANGIDGVPALFIRWQNGPMDRDADGNGKANGAFVEDVLEVCRRRLQFYQESPFNCEENATALAHVDGAIAALLERRTDRKARGVEGEARGLTRCGNAESERPVVGLSNDPEV